MLRINKKRHFGAFYADLVYEKMVPKNKKGFREVFEKKNKLKLETQVRSVFQSVESHVDVHYKYSTFNFSLFKVLWEAQMNKKNQIKRRRKIERFFCGKPHVYIISDSFLICIFNFCKL